jgi:hypothetical protein
VLRQQRQQPRDNAAQHHCGTTSVPSRPGAETQIRTFTPSSTTLTAALTPALASDARSRAASPLMRATRLSAILLVVALVWYGLFVWLGYALWFFGLIHGWKFDLMLDLQLKGLVLVAGVGGVAVLCHVAG